ncbi:cation:proton antiporter [Fusibacter sp. JL216-2]|uniref:cation:proton antiporter n=1 Tax=Fusibacter sp. JL216-2 TaxID=3071453 RepID=UPI003D32AA23
MHTKLAFILEIGVILFAANIGGLISRKLKQPAVLGQIIAGIVLGLGMMEKTAMIEHMGEIGVIFLMFIAGLETDVKELQESSKSSSLIAIGGVIVPIILVTGGTYFVTKDLTSAVFMGVISTATSVSISVQTLRELGQLRTRQGIGILGAAIIDDIVGIILLTLIVGVIKPEVSSSVVVVLAKIVGFFLLVFVVGAIITKLIQKYGKAIRIEEKIVTYSIVTCFILAFISEELGVAAITGAYFSGVVFSMTEYRHKVSHEVNRIATIMFTPIFFVSIGMGVNLNAALSAIGVGSVFIAMGFLGKVIGCGIGARLSGFNKKRALQIGFGMVPRAEVAIIIANLGIKMGIIGQHELAAVILMVLVTTLITPSLLKWSFEGEEERHSRAKAA